MIWSTEKELRSTVERVREHCNTLEKQECLQSPIGVLDIGVKPEAAPGSERDIALHKGAVVSTQAVTSEMFRCREVRCTSKPEIKEEQLVDLNIEGLQPQNHNGVTRPPEPDHGVSRVVSNTAEHNNTTPLV